MLSLKTRMVASEPLKIVGRYALFDRIAAGGMASVHFGRLLGEAGFTRTVAIKRLHPQFALEPDFVAMFLDEARLAARIRHPNVVATLDVVAADDELFLVMEYVEGESLAKLLKPLREHRRFIEPRIAAAIAVGILNGLHAAHEAKSDKGEPLDIVHRDVSPQNVLVGVDGTARLVDFGVAKAVTQIHTTREGQVKGKLAYMAPEQIQGARVTRQTDVFAAAVVFWELLTLNRLFASDNEGETIQKIVNMPAEAPSKRRPDLPAALDEVVLRGLERDPARRWRTAAEMAQAIEAVVEPATANRVGRWVRDAAADVLASRAGLVANIESNSSLVAVPLPPESHPSRVSVPRSQPGPSQPTPGLADAETQVSSLSVASTAFYPARRRSRLRLLGGLAAAAVAALASVLVVVKWTSGTNGAASSSATTAAASASSAAPPPSAAASAAESPPVVAADSASAQPGDRSTKPVIPVTALPTVARPTTHVYRHKAKVTEPKSPKSPKENSSTTVPNPASLYGRE